MPVFTPLSFHWYTGVVPPFTAAAVKFTIVPAQIFVADEEILMAGVTGVFTDIVKLLDVAVAVVTQVTLLRKMQVTTSPLFKVELL